MSHDFQRKLDFLGIESSPSYLRSPEGRGVIERFSRTLKEQLLWLQDFEDEDALRKALYVFRERYNANWIMRRDGYRTPNQVRAEWGGKLEMAS